MDSAHSLSYYHLLRERVLDGTTEETAMDSIARQRVGLWRHTRDRMLLTAWLCIAVATLCTSGTAAGTGSEEIASGSGFRGGLVVEVGLRDPTLAIALGKPENVLVQGLVRDRGTLPGVRKKIQDAGLYGRVTAVEWSGTCLPYADGTVNLLLLLDESVETAEGEIDRVLGLRGVACIVRGGVLSYHRKEWPEDIDDWRHSRYDSTANAVSRDKRVGPPLFMRWEALPRWNKGTKTSCLVSSGGRIFYILDDTHFAAGAFGWSLIARDAGNGIRLWRHPLTSWAGAKGGKKVGPAQVHRRLIASDDKVYVTLGESAPVSVLDAATGDAIRVLDATADTTEMLLSEGVLLVLVEHGRNAKIAAFDPDSGKQLWEHVPERILPLSMAADARQVVYHDGKVIRSLDLKRGTARWMSPPTGQKIERRSSANPDSPGAGKLTILLAPQFAPTMVIYEDVVAFAGGRQINVVSASDGRELWRKDYAASNYSVPVEIFGFDGLLWGPDTGMNLWRPTDDNIDFNAYDPLTGDIRKRVEGKYGFRFQHHRCNQMKVVDGAVLSARAGIEFLDTETGDVASHHWTRGSCFYGVMPANGLLYVPPHNCACYVRAKLSGFMALAGAASGPSSPDGSVAAGERPASAAAAAVTQVPNGGRLQKGPAYGSPIPQSAIGNRQSDWPTYRRDPARSGGTTAKVGSELLLGWQAELGGKLTSPVIANGRVYVASIDRHRLYASDAETGKTLWDVTLGGRMDSPPTIHDGLVLCGCRDGCVYAFRETDGVLAWRFLAASAERKIVSRGQLESVRPVHGSVLVVNDTVYFAAGRTSYLDGGIRLYGLDPRTGAVRVESSLWTRDETGAELMDEESVEGFLNDILSSDGKRVFMRHHAIDLAGKALPERVTHLHGADGYLSWDTTSRLLWTYAPIYTSRHQGAFYDVRLSRSLFPSGRILVAGDDTIYGYGENHYRKMRPDTGGEWEVFASPKKYDAPENLTAREYRSLSLKGKQTVRFRWHERVPLQVWAMVKTEDALFVAGPPGRPPAPPEAIAGKSPGQLLAMSAEDGAVLAEMLLPSPPVWDGMAVAGGNLYIALANGGVMCLWSAASGKPGTPLSTAGWAAMLPPVVVEKEPGLLGCWRFDEGAGMLARDGSGRGHDADVNGTWGKGDFGTCLVSTGKPRIAVIPDEEHLRFGTNDFSLVFWVKIDGGKARLLGKEAFPQNWWVINLTDDGKAELVLGEGRGEGQSVRLKTTLPLATDAWTHLAVVAGRKAGQVQWYINGEPDSKAAVGANMTAGLTGGDADISIPSKYLPFRGLIGELRIYGRPLTAGRVKELFEEKSAHLKHTTLSPRR